MFCSIFLGQGPTVLAVGAGSARLEIFSLVQTLSEGNAVFKGR